MVLTLHRSLVTGQHLAILHKLTTLRLFAKLAGFLFFAAHWRLAVLAPEKVETSLFFAWGLPTALMCSLPLDVEALAREAGENGSYELFLLWAPELFHFVTNTMVRANTQLKGFFSLVTAYYLFVSRRALRCSDQAHSIFTSSSLLILALSQRLMQITSSSYSHFLRRPSLPPLTPPSLASSLLLFLLQFFDSSISTSLSTLVRTEYYFKNCDSSTPSLPSSARKIRPGTLPSSLPTPPPTTPILSVDAERSLTLLKVLERQYPEDYAVVSSFCQLLLKASAKQQLTEGFVREQLRRCTNAVVELVRRMYEAVQKDSVETVLNHSHGKVVEVPVEEALVALQSRVELLVLKEGMAVVMADCTEQLNQACAVRSFGVGWE